jgi:hypothetical protein
MIALATRSGRMPRTSISPRLAAILAEREVILDERDRLLDLLQLRRARLRLNLGRHLRRRRQMIVLTRGSDGEGSHGNLRPSPGWKGGDPLGRFHRQTHDMG